MQATQDLDAEDYGIAEMFGGIPSIDTPEPQPRSPLDNIPHELKEIPRWVLWCSQKAPRTTKGAFALTNKPQTWTDYKTARKAFESGVRVEKSENEFAKGIGIVVPPDFICVDLDKCRNVETGKIEPWAETIIDELQSWTEFSQSGTGFHIFIKAKLPEGNEKLSPPGVKEKRLEVFRGKVGGGKFVAMTGNVFDRAPSKIRSIDDAEILAWFKKYDKEEKAPPPPPPPQAEQSQSNTYDPHRLREWGLARLEGIASALSNNTVEGEKDVRLYAAALSAKRGIPHCYSQSEAFDELWRVVKGWGDRVKDEANARKTIENGLQKGTHPPAYPQDDSRHKKQATWMPIVERRKAGAVQFPVNTMPRVIQRLLQTNSLGMPPGMLGIATLCTASAAIGGDIRIKGRGSHQESACLWGMVVAEPGAKKSPSLGIAAKPFKQSNDRAIDEWNQKEPDRKHKREQYAREKKAWEEGFQRAKREKKAFDDPEPTEPKAQPYPYGIITDTTLEALNKAINENPSARIFGYFDELATLLDNFTRYNAGSDRSYWLQIHGSETISKIRAGESTPIHIKNPYVPIVGGIQNDKFARTFGGKLGIGDGLLERFLFAIPDPMEPRQEDTHSEREKEDAHKSYCNVINEILKIEFKLPEDSEPLAISLSDAAKEMFRVFEKEKETSRPRWVTQATKQLMGKASMVVLRVALVLHVVRFASKETSDLYAVDAATITSAIEFFEKYALPTYARALAMLNDTPEDKKAETVLAWLKKKQLQRVAPYHLVQAGLPGIDAAKDAQTALLCLSEWGAVRSTEKMEGSGQKGRPPSGYLVHPCIVEGGSYVSVWE